MAVTFGDFCQVVREYLREEIEGGSGAIPINIAALIDTGRVDRILVKLAHRQPLNQDEIELLKLGVKRQLLLPVDDN